MLILTSKVGEAVLIGDNILVRVLAISEHGAVKIGYEVPKHINVLREIAKKKIEAAGKIVYTEKPNETI